MENMMQVIIRPIAPTDEAAVWGVLSPIFRAGDTYAIDPDISRKTALSYWASAPHMAYVATENNIILGTYYIGPNQQGGGAHVCNCGFATAAMARGKGIAQKMLDHALSQARTQGYRAMQFNFVVTSNSAAIHLWHKARFKTVGRLPLAFKHPQKGYVDALVMYKTL